MEEQVGIFCSQKMFLFFLKEAIKVEMAITVSISRCIHTIYLMI